MPRIRQYADLYAQRDFWREIDRRCPDAGVGLPYLRVECVR